MDALVLRPLAWGVRRLGGRTVLALCFVLIALSSVALGLAGLIRGLDDGLLVTVVFFGVILGWLLARSALPEWLALSLAVSLGVEVALYRLARLATPLRSVTGSAIDLVRDVISWSQGGLSPDAASLIGALGKLTTAANSALSHVFDWARHLVRGEAAFDPAIVGLLWVLGIYTAAVWAGWAVRRRHQPLVGLAPAGALLAVSLSYTFGSPVYLQVLVGTALLLMVTIRQIARERRWESAGVDYSPELRFDLAFAVTPLWLALLAVIMIAPSISVRPIASYVDHLIAKHRDTGVKVADSLGLKTLGGTRAALTQARAGGLPNANLIGSGSELSEQTMMIVEIGGMSPQRHRWRGVTYDVYTGRGWRTNETERTTYRAGEALQRNPRCPAGACQDETGPTHQLLRQKVYSTDGLGGLVHTAGELVSVDQTLTSAWRSFGDLIGAETGAKEYRADSIVSIASEAELRAAGTDYPDWVRERYLALPRDVPERVYALAQTLTTALSTPYEKARAVESYLRSFPYTLDVPAPPADRDIADYFLFDLRRGYCDYYASSMVVLARAIGVPSRLVVGYASGSYDSTNAQYVIAASDAHSWAEVYFPGYGWIEFEPTSGRPAIERPLEREFADYPDSSMTSDATGTGLASVFRLIILGLFGGLLTFAVLGLSWWAIDNRRLQNLSPNVTLTTIFRRLYHHAVRLDVPLEPGFTPYEFQAELGDELSALGQSGRVGRVANEVNKEVVWLTDHFVRGLYSPRRIDSVTQIALVESWRRLKPRLWLLRIVRRTKRIRGRQA